MTLYQINKAIIACVDPETGEFHEEQYEALQLAREEKIENTALYIKNLKAEAEMLKTEAKAYTERAKEKENRAAYLHDMLMRELAGENFETKRCALKFRASKKVEILDISKIPDDYLKYSMPTPDKNAIKAAIKDGIQIDGAVLVDSTTMSIK